MAPGLIPRDYVTQEKFDELELRVERQSEALVVLADVMKILASRIYSGKSDKSDKSAQEIYEKALKMVGSWKDD